MFHTLAGYDIMSSFAGHSNKTTWAIWTMLPELTYAVLKLSAAPSDILKDVMHTIDSFVILLYGRTSSCADSDKTRKKLFAKKNNVYLIPTLRQLWRSMSRGRPTREAMCGARHCYRHRSYLHQPAGAGLRTRKVCTSRTGQDYTRQPTPAMNMKRCNCKKATLECTALCVRVRVVVVCACVRVCVKGSAHIIEFLATEGNCDTNPGDI